MENIDYNKLNKFLSYIHMGNDVFRLYYKHAEKIDNQELKELIVEIQEVFKQHEENMTNIIKSKGIDPTDSLTIQGKMGVIMENLKIIDNEFSIALDALKAVNMGEISALKFMYENKKIDESIINDLKIIITDYDKIKTKIKNYIYMCIQ